MTYAPPPASAPTATPGKTLGIVGLILAFFLPVVGLILSIVGKVQSSKAGASNGPAVAGIIVSIVSIVIWIVVGVILGVTTAALLAQCQELGPGTHVVGGVTYTCGY